VDDEEDVVVLVLEGTESIYVSARVVPSADSPPLINISPPSGFKRVAAWPHRGVGREHPAANSTALHCISFPALKMRVIGEDEEDVLVDVEVGLELRDEDNPLRGIVRGAELWLSEVEVAVPSWTEFTNRANAFSEASWTLIPDVIVEEDEEEDFDDDCGTVFSKRSATAAPRVDSRDFFAATLWAVFAVTLWRFTAFTGIVDTALESPTVSFTNGDSIVFNRGQKFKLSKKRENARFRSKSTLTTLRSLHLLESKSWQYYLYFLL
jgi:hypothetical protein